MFGLAKRAEPASNVVHLIQPQGKEPPRLVTDKVKSYEELAAQLGFAPEELVRARLLTFFCDHGIKVYDYAEVDAYLKKKRQIDKQERWVWRPLRSQDRPSDDWAAHGSWYGDGALIRSACPPYSRLVPQHALEKVANIKKTFGDQVQFFVSDYPVPAPDPFIGVRVKGSVDPVEQAMLIFDVWDEPGFGVE